MFQLFDEHLMSGRYRWACLPELQHKTMVCHCRDDQRCHGDVLRQALAERLQSRTTGSYLEQLAQAAAVEGFAGTAQLTASLRDLNVRTLPPYERSKEDVKSGRTHTSTCLSGPL